MKKFRILAAILAVLMLPIGLLVACDGGKTDDPVDPGSSSSSSTTEIVDNPPEEVYDNDGTGTGYLMFFNFDAASRGDFRDDKKPYSTYFEKGSGNSVIYIVDSTAGKNGGGALLIQREGSAESASLKINAANAVTGLGGQHTIEFDIKVGEGYITDDVVFYGSKGTDTVDFIKITPDAVCDGSGNLLYAIKADEGWLHISLSIDDSARVYSVYVNGGKVSDKSTYTTAAYGSWESFKTTAYNFRTGTSKTNLYVYLDNFGISDGLDPKVRDTSNDDVTYTDSLTDTLAYYSSANKDDYLRVLKSTSSLLKSTPYGLGSLLSDSLAMFKYNENTNEFTRVTYDYGVELGLYGYGADFGNKVFRKDDDNYIFFKATPLLEYEGKIGGSEVSGFYTLSGSEDEPRATVSWNDGVLDKALYGRLNMETGNVTFYTDEKLTEGAEEYAFVASELPFSGVKYALNAGGLSVSLTAYEYTKVADLEISGDTAVSAEGAAFTYADGVLKVTVDGTEYTFTYNADNDTFTYDGKTLTVYDPWVLADGEFFCTELSHFTSYKSQLDDTNPDFAAEWDPQVSPTQWSTIRFRYYIPESTVGYRFVFIVDTGNSSEGWSYYSVNIQQSSPGWYTYEAQLSSMGKSRTPDPARIKGRWELVASGWKTGPAGSQDGKTYPDGYEIIIRDVMFVAERSVVVNGPDAEHESCTHEQNGVSTFEKTDIYTAPTCTTVGFYSLKCSICGATKVDTDKDIAKAFGHNVDGAELLTYPATCTEDGYTYRICNTCGIEVIETKIAATGHMNVSSYDPNTKSLELMCVNCGNKSGFVLDEKLLTGKEKIEALGLTNAQQFAVWEGNNDTFTYSDNSGSKQYTDGAIEFTLKYATISTGKLADGTYYFKHTKDSGSSDSYFDLNPFNQFEAGSTFVFEFDMMLGDKTASGKYMRQSSTIMDRKSMVTDAGLFTISEDGVLVMSTDSTKTVQLSADRFMNIAFVIKPVDNAIDVYVDGYLVYEGITLKVGVDMSKFQAEDIRISCIGGVTGEEGASHYFNNIMVYQDDYPYCVLGVGSSSGVQEYVGDIALEKDGAAVGSALTVSSEDALLSLPIYTVTSRYVLDFKLTASALTDGALLVGHKMDEYRFGNDLDLLTVKSGYIYFLDTAICEVSKAKDGVQITLVCDDRNGQVTVYVNGEEVLGGVISYPDGAYAASESVLTGVTFKAGNSYEISGLAMYTGLEVK